MSSFEHRNNRKSSPRLHRGHPLSFYSGCNVSSYSVVQRCKTWDAVVLAETSNLASHVLVRLQEILTFFAFDTNHFIAAILEMKNLFIVCRVHRHRALYSCFGAVRVELTRHVLTSRTQ